MTNISRTAIDDKLFRFWMGLAAEYSSRAADRLISPLEWWVNTCRADTSFLHWMLAARVSTFVKELGGGGSDEEIIRRLCKRAESYRCI